MVAEISECILALDSYFGFSILALSRAYTLRPLLLKLQQLILNLNVLHAIYLLKQNSQYVEQI